MALQSHARDYLNRMMTDCGEHVQMDNDRSQSLLTLAGALGLYPQYGRAIQYYEQLAGSRPRSLQDAPTLRFLEAGPTARARVNRVLPNRPDPARPYRLQVVYGRGRGGRR